MSRVEDLRKLSMLLATLADVEETIYSNVKTVTSAARLAHVALRVPDPASGFGGGQRLPPPPVSLRYLVKDLLSRLLERMGRALKGPPPPMVQGLCNNIPHFRKILVGGSQHEPAHYPFLHTQNKQGQHERAQHSHMHTEKNREPQRARTCRRQEQTHRSGETT